MWKRSILHIGILQCKMEFKLGMRKDINCIKESRRIFMWHFHKFEFLTKYAICCKALQFATDVVIYLRLIVAPLKCQEILQLEVCGLLETNLCITLYHLKMLYLLNPGWFDFFLFYLDQCRHWSFVWLISDTEVFQSLRVSGVVKLIGVYDETFMAMNMKVWTCDFSFPTLSLCNTRFGWFLAPV